MSGDDATERRFAKLEARIAILEKGAAVGRPADDADLDSEWGDPVVRKDPSRWKGQSFAGRHMSECPSDYLLSLAGLFDWMADKDEEKGNTYTHKTSGEQVPTAPFKRKDAARARGWAARNKGKGVPPVESVGTDDIPF